jgi:hypothetical protein
MNPLTSKIIKTVAFFAVALTIPAMLAHQVKVENEAATADIDAIINKECARQKKSGAVSPSCPDSYR